MVGVGVPRAALWVWQPESPNPATLLYHRAARAESWRQPIIPVLPAGNFLTYMEMSLQQAAEGLTLLHSGGLCTLSPEPVLQCC